MEHPNKTPKQIAHFLRSQQFASLLDFEIIASYCKNHQRVRLYKPSETFPDNPNALTADKFSQWLKSGYAAGDIIVWKDESGEENIGLVQSSDLNSVKICLRIVRNTPIFDSITLDGQLIHLAPENAAEGIFRTLNEQNKEFGNPDFVITDKYIPSDGELVIFKNHKTGLEGLGVIAVNGEETGDVILFCYVDRQKQYEPHYRMHEPIGQLADISFQSFKAADYERKVLDEELEKVGKTWNHHLKRIEPIQMKVETGSEYFYITSKWAVEKDIEKGGMVSHKRYLVGNYFKSNNEALEVLKQINQVFNNHWAEPGI